MSEELFLQNLPLVDEVLRFVCRRNQLSGADAEDFAAAVKLRLVEGDYAILRKFSGAASADSGSEAADDRLPSLRAYLAVVIHRLLLDDRVAKWGKWRPSAEARRRGEVALRLEELIYRDGFAPKTALRRLESEEKVRATARELEETLAALPRRIKRRLASEADLSQHAAPEATRPDARLERADSRAAQRHAIEALRAALDRLPAEERAVLRLRFDQGLTVPQIAPQLGLEAKPLYRRLERILAGLRRTLGEQGVAAADILPSLGSAWLDTDNEIGTPSPARPDADSDPNAGTGSESGGGPGSAVPPPGTRHSSPSTGDGSQAPRGASEANPGALK